MFGLAALDARWSFLEAILDGLATMAVPVHQIAKEYGPAQVPSCRCYRLTRWPAVDSFLAARDLIKALARDRGLLVSFMPKPTEDLPGSGLHVHISMVDADDEDALADRSDTAGSVADRRGGRCRSPRPCGGADRARGPDPEQLQTAPARILGAGPCVLGRRQPLGPRQDPSIGPGRHLEYRSGDMGANLYLHLTGLLASIVDGLDRGAEPPAPIQADVGHLSDAAAAALGATRLPTRLDVALESLESDPILVEALGTLIVRHYLAVKRFEWSSYLAGSGLAADDVRVSDWERATYLDPL